MRYEQLRKTYEDRWKGLNQGIPVNSKYKRLREVIPSWDLGEATLLLGQSGSGKTRFIFKVLVLDSLKFMSKNPKKKVRILFNSLELSELDFYSMLVCYLFKEKLGIVMSSEYLLNKLQKEELDVQLFENLEKIKPQIEFFNSWVTIKDDIRTADAWFKYCKKILDDAGYVDEQGKYQKKDPNLHFIILVDTLNALSIPSGSNKLVEMTKYSSEYMKQTLRGFYKCHCVQLQQMSKDPQSSQFSMKGSRIEEKLLPQASDAKDFRSSEDDNSLVLSIFLPHKFRLDKWEGYDVKLFNKKLSFIYILKSNFTATPIDEPIPFYIDHSTLSYEEIPDMYKHPILYKAFLKEKGLLEEGVSLVSPAKLQFEQLFNKENGTIELE